MDTDKKQIATGQRREGGLVEEKLTEQIIGAAYEVHRELGSGFLEKVYASALHRELSSRDISSSAQSEIKVPYKDHPVGVYYADLLVEGKVICELKAVKALLREHQAQLLNYLKATGIKVGLLINFGSGRCQIKRMVF
jgi:GxxExxY protein